MSSFFQSLEGRTLLSASVKAVSPQLAADVQQYQADIQQYKDDATLMNTTLTADRAKVAADNKAIGDAKTGAKTKLQMDNVSFVNELKVNSDKGTPIYNKWKPVLDSDQAAVKKDGEHGEHLADDKAKYLSDYNAFRQEMQPVEDGTKAIIAKWKPVLDADKAAISTGGSDLCKQLKADKNQLSTDETSFKKLLVADQKKINADAAQMKKDGGGDHKDRDKKTEPTKPENKK